MTELKLQKSRPRMKQTTIGIIEPVVYLQWIHPRMENSNLYFK